MSPVAELGPLDPQIIQLNPIEGRFESFSPLHIKSTLDIIRQEFVEGNENLAKSLIERLQFPMTLGSFLKYNEIGKQYLIRLLESRMLKEKSSDFIEAIANQLTTGYADHSFCINIDEAIKLGLKVTELKGEELDIIWEIYMLNKEKEEILMSIKKVDVNEFLKNLPPDLITKLPEPIQTKIKPKKPK